MQTCDNTNVCLNIFKFEFSRNGTAIRTRWLGNSRIFRIFYVYQNDRPLSVVGLRRKRCPVTLTVTAWVQFLPSPTHETCLCCSAMSGLMKLACLYQSDLAKSIVSCHCTGMQYKIPILFSQHPYIKFAGLHHPMPHDKETVIRSMVLRNYPDFDVVFMDPMFAFIFMPKSFDTEFSLIFCTNSRSQGKEVSIEKVRLDYMASVKYLTTPTQSLFEQLQTIKGMLRTETTALQFSEISRELIVAKSNFKFGQILGKDGENANLKNSNIIESFDIRCLNLFTEKSFRRLVGTLTNFITSTTDSVTWIKDSGFDRHILSRAHRCKPIFLWIRDDDFIIVIKMPSSGDNLLGDGSDFENEDIAPFESSELEWQAQTWNDMFGSIQGARCENAGIVFLISGDRIRYICARNVNMFDSYWASGHPELPVIWCKPDADLRFCWHETKVQQTTRKLNAPYLPNGSRIRDMVEDTTHYIDTDRLKSHPKLLIYICLSVMLTKDFYNRKSLLNSCFYCERNMFQSDGWLTLLRSWTAYILGQSESHAFKEKYKGSINSIFCFNVHNVEINGTPTARQISWQFNPIRFELEVFDSVKQGTKLQNKDTPGTRIDLRAEMN